MTPAEILAQHGPRAGTALYDAVGATIENTSANDRGAEKIICVGLNYRDHILEMGNTPPDYPTIFAKYAPALIGAHDDIVLPLWKSVNTRGRISRAA